MKRKKSYIAIMAAVACLTGCAAAPVRNEPSACGLLNIALDEADMSSTWFDGAGKVLAECGMPDALERAEFKSCMRERRDGDTRVCHEQ